MKLSKWLVGMVAGLALSATALASFPTQEYIDELNTAMRDYVDSQIGQFDDDGLQVIAMNISGNPSTRQLLMTMGMMVSDTISAADRQVLIDDLKVDHLGLACDFVEIYAFDFDFIDSLKLHFVVTNESKELLYDVEKVCTADDYFG